MRVRPRLLKRGEPVTLTIRVIAEQPPNHKLTFYPQHLREGRDKGAELTLDWRRDTDDQGHPVFVAACKLPADQLGNHLIQWRCDIGGDTEDYWRNFAVVNDDSTIVLLNDCGADDENRSQTDARASPATHLLE